MPKKLPLHLNHKNRSLRDFLYQKIDREKKMIICERFRYIKFADHFYQ